MDDKIKVRLIIADKDYVLTIPRNDEEIVRKAARQINDKLNKYRSKFPNIEHERFMGMVALDFATDKLRLENKNDTAPLTEKIKELTEKLDKHFREDSNY